MSIRSTSRYFVGLALVLSKVGCGLGLGGERETPYCEAHQAGVFDSEVDH